MRETWIWSLGQEDPLEKGMATTPVFLPGKSHAWRSLAGYSPWVCKESDTTWETNPLGGGGGSEESPALPFPDQLCFLRTLGSLRLLLFWGHYPPVSSFPRFLLFPQFLSFLVLSSKSTNLPFFFPLGNQLNIISYPTEAPDFLRTVKHLVSQPWFCNLETQPLIMTISTMTPLLRLTPGRVSTTWEGHEGCWFGHSKLPALLPASLRSTDSTQHENRKNLRSQA